MSLVRIDDGLPRLLTPMPLDKAFEAESNSIGARGCHALVDESIDSGKETIVDSCNELCHAFNIADCHAEGAPVAHDVPASRLQTPWRNWQTRQV
ncbi:MAG: hypothetical protein ACRDYY_09440 [Acidimicrobiales bacterium]